MPIYQSFNKRTNSWVKYKITKTGSKILNVKQIKPLIPFKGVMKKK